MANDLATLYERRALTRAVNDPSLKPQPAFLSDRYFGGSNPRQVFAEYVDFEIRKGSRGLAKFRHRGQEANIVGKTGGTVQSFKLPNIREKKVLTAVELLRENPLGNVYNATASSISQARDLAIARELLDLKNRTVRRREWMAAQMLTTGKITYADESIAWTLDLQITSTFKPGLSGTDLWTNSASNPAIQLLDWQTLINVATGQNLKEVVLGSDAAKAFTQNALVMKQLNNLNYRTGALTIDVRGNFLGTYANVDFYTLAESYEDENGDVQQLFPADMALAMPDNFNAETLTGVVDEVDQVFAGEYFSKSWVTPDPSERWLLVASRPITMAYEPGSWIMATVV